MLFNGKFWNKPGHLGMTRQQLKEALKALPAPEAGDAGKPVIVNEDGDGYVLGETGGGFDDVFLHKIKFNYQAPFGNKRWVHFGILSRRSSAYTSQTLKDDLHAWGDDKSYIPLFTYPDCLENGAEIVTLESLIYRSSTDSLAANMLILTLTINGSSIAITRSEPNAGLGTLYNLTDTIQPFSDIL